MARLCGATTLILATLLACGGTHLGVEGSYRGNVTWDGRCVAGPNVRPFVSTIEEIWDVSELGGDSLAIDTHATCGIVPAVYQANSMALVDRTRCPFDDSQLKISVSFDGGKISWGGARMEPEISASFKSTDGATCSTTISGTLVRMRPEGKK